MKSSGWIAAKLMHHRLGPVAHSFVYPAFYFVLDLDELSSLSETLLGFSHNRFNLFSLFDRDYLKPGPKDLKAKLWEVLREKPYLSEISSIKLITVPRVLGYCFNPVSFYYCLNAAAEPLVIVAEVNNTFAERHLYILDKDTATGSAYRHELEKSFYVSPFNEVSGRYSFSFGKLTPADTWEVRVNILQEGQEVFRSGIKGQLEALGRGTVFKVLGKFAFNAWLALPRITWEAAKLYYLRGITVKMKPALVEELSFRVQSPSVISRLCRWSVEKFLGRIKRGQLILQYPDGSETHFGDLGSKTPITLSIVDWDFFRRVAKAGDIGFGESYSEGLCEVSDLIGMIKLFLQNEEYFHDIPLPFYLLDKFRNRLSHLRRPNSVTGSAQNIEAHYDLSNNFFELFLDSSLSYSCALFKHAGLTDGGETLEQAQLNKIDAVLDRLALKSSDQLLEIGSGWGALAIRAASRFGCHVTTITLSHKQQELAQARIQAAGLSHLIEVRLIDYRKVEGSFDKIVSVEMLEAVGHQYFASFFQTCERLLKRNGIISLQVITIPDQRYDIYLRSVDWIQKYIFPGGTLPSLTALSEAMTRNSSLVIEELQNIGVHYAWTLAAWRERFESSLEQIRALGFDERFIRMWRYYLCYCEAGFATRNLNTLQLTITRPANELMPGFNGIIE